jgi:hypothetical protein
MSRRSRSGRTVCVCEPHAVRTAVTYSGSVGSDTSKIRMPSQFVAGFVVSGEVTVPSHSALLRRESVDVTRMPSSQSSNVALGIDASVASAQASGWAEAMTH